MKSIRSIKSLKGKTVLLRADFDVPHDGARVLDDHRIKAVIPTIKHLHKLGAKVVIMSHMGRPEAQSDSLKWDMAESLRIATKHLANLLGLKMIVARDRLPEYDIKHLIFFGGDMRDPKSRELIKNANSKDIIILENTRFYPEEHAGDLKFAKQLASIADIYVNEAFAVSHRSDLSIAVLPKQLTSYAGLNLEKEIQNLDKVLSAKLSPFVAVMGGIKISDKVGAIKNLAKKADHILVGGGLANLFFLSQGFEIGKSKVESEKVDLAREITRNFKKIIVLPVDVVVAKTGKAGFKDIRVCKPTEVKATESILDIGPQTILNFSQKIKTAKKLVWNGPMGLFEQKPFSYGTMSVALVFSARSQGSSFGVIGGGDTLEAASKAKITEKVDFASTGGGAMLEYLSGKTLPGLKALE